MEPPFVWRTWRWLAVLADRVVVRADDEEAWRRLGIEAEIMARFRAAAGPCVPVVMASDPLTRTQTRERIEGMSGLAVERLILGTTADLAALDRYGETCPLTEPGARLARDLGHALASFHRALTAEEAAKLGLARTEPRLDDETAAIVRRHAGSPVLERALASARAWLAARARDDVVVHGDPHLHNVAVDETTGALRGIFDFDEIGLADRARDLAYLHSSGLPFARAALRAYAEVGPLVDEDVVGRYHVLVALEHFNFVAPTAERFPEIVRWATAAVSALAPDWR